MHFSMSMQVSLPPTLQTTMTQTEHHDLRPDNNSEQGSYIGVDASRGMLAETTIAKAGEQIVQDRPVRSLA